MARSSKGKVARLPAYWFRWYPYPRSTEFYVKVYWAVKKARVRKSNKPEVLKIMRLVDICDTSATH